jgi:FMN phosphatase YigB (HAD superfamily)
MHRDENQPVEGVIFDLDGTLYHMKWFMRPLLWFMLLPSVSLLPKYMSVRARHKGRDEGSAERLLEVLAEQLALSAGVKNPETIKSWIRSRFYPAFVSIMPLLKGSRPGLEGELHRMREAGIRTAVLSDFGRVEQRLEGLALSHTCFDSVLSAEEIGCLKPCARPFLSLASRWHIDPSRILVVGDRADTDGAAAQSVGMQFLMVSDGKKRAGQAQRWPAVRDRLAGLAGPKA